MVRKEDGRYFIEYPRSLLIFYPSEIRDHMDNVESANTLSDLMKLLPVELTEKGLKRGKYHQRSERFGGRAKGTWGTR